MSNAGVSGRIRGAHSRRLLDWIAYGVASAFLLLTATTVLTWLQLGDTHIVGQDFRIYLDAAKSWLGGGSFYLAHQLAGPYVITHGDVLYPPTALPLFVVFTVLPGPLWWAIPLLLTAAIVVWNRPSPLAWAGIAFCIWFPPTILKLLTGNPVIWSLLAVAAGTRWGWPGAWVLLKPSLFPFAAVGIQSRGWWISLAVMACIAVLLAPLTVDWVSALTNSSNPGGLLYSLQEAPMLALPIVAWLGSTVRRVTPSPVPA